MSFLFPAKQTRPTEQALNALRVISTTPSIRLWLKDHDPKALEQVDGAIESLSPEVLAGVFQDLGEVL